MNAQFCTTPAVQLRPELKLIAARARWGHGTITFKCGDLTIRCLLGAVRDAAGFITGLEPVFDAIYFAPDYSWRCGKFDEIKFTTFDIGEMERWLRNRQDHGERDRPCVSSSVH